MAHWPKWVCTTHQQLIARRLCQYPHIVLTRLLFVGKKKKETKLAYQNLLMASSFNGLKAHSCQVIIYMTIKRKLMQAFNMLSDAFNFTGSQIYWKWTCPKINHKQNTKFDGSGCVLYIYVCFYWPIYISKNTKNWPVIFNALSSFESTNDMSNFPLKQ